MASFTGKSIKDIYKDILHTDNSNSGLATTIKQIKCGDGASTALYLSSKNLKVKPGADIANFVQFEDADGNALVLVDSTNDLVKLGIGQHIANTQFEEFGVFDFSPLAGVHFPLMNNCWTPELSVWTGDANGTNWAGTGTNPATSLILASASFQFVPGLWLLQQNITIDSIQYIMGSNNSSTISLQVMSYTFQTGSGATAGDLSSGEVIAQTGSSSDAGDLAPVTTGDDRASNGTLTINTTDIASGKAILVFAEASDADDMTVSVTIKYHLR